MLSVSQWKVGAVSAIFLTSPGRVGHPVTSRFVVLAFSERLASQAITRTNGDCNEPVVPAASHTVNASEHQPLTSCGATGPLVTCSHERQRDAWITAPLMGYDGTVWVVSLRHTRSSNDETMGCQLIKCQTTVFNYSVHRLRRTSGAAPLA